MDIVDKYKENNNHSRYIYNLVSIENVKNILKYGILSKNEMISKGLRSISIANDEVQSRRDLVKVPNGLYLHDYANLYMDFRNPMLSSLRHKNNDICIICIDPKILNIQGVVMSDMNAARSLVSFFDVKSGLKNIDFNKIFMDNWTSDDSVIYDDNKGAKCAEVLVPHTITPDYILGFIVCSEEAKTKLEKNITDKKIIVRPGLFF